MFANEVEAIFEVQQRPTTPCIDGDLTIGDIFDENNSDFR